MPNFQVEMRVMFVVSAPTALDALNIGEGLVKNKLADIGYLEVDRYTARLATIIPDTKTPQIEAKEGGK